MTDRLYANWERETVIAVSLGNMPYEEYSPEERATWIAASLLRWAEDNDISLNYHNAYQQAETIIGWDGEP